MIATFKYIGSLVRHKWYVMRACVRLGLYWRGIVHDLSKLSPTEFRAYVKRFGGKKGIDAGRDKSGFYEPMDDPTMAKAWAHHARANRHHWQYHCVPRHRCLEGAGHALEVMEMEPRDILEMLADWWGAGRAYKGAGIADYWRKNNRRMRLGRNTRRWIDYNILKVEDYLDRKKGSKRPDPRKPIIADQAIYMSDVSVDGRESHGLQGDD